MHRHEKDTTIATVLSTVLTVIGTTAALTYYISLSKYSSLTLMIHIVGAYLLLLCAIYQTLHWRYEDVAQE